MDSRDKLRLFASQVARVARDLTLVRDPRFDERRSRLVDGALSIDLLNMLHVVSWQTVEDAVVADILKPRTLGAAGWLGRVDIVRAMLAAGTDAAAPDPDGITPIDRTICAWVTTDLHVACIEAMLDAGATPLPPRMPRACASRPSATPPASRSPSCSHGARRPSCATTSRRSPTSSARTRCPASRSISAPTAPPRGTRRACRHP